MNTKPRAIIVSCCFNPRHEGHIEYFYNEKADQLIVIVNSVHKEL
jgi:nicotinamide mononucleotide adenylyltransferase